MTGSQLSADRLARVHDGTRAHVEGGGVPGLVSVAHARRGEVHLDCTGLHQRPPKTGGEIGPNTIFRISFMT